MSVQPHHHPLGDWPLACGHTIADARISYLQIGDANPDGSNRLPVGLDERPARRKDEAGNALNARNIGRIF